MCVCMRACIITYAHLTDIYLWPVTLYDTEYKGKSYFTLDDRIYFEVGFHVVQHALSKLCTEGHTKYITGMCFCFIHPSKIDRALYFNFHLKITAFTYCLTNVTQIFY